MPEDRDHNARDDAATPEDEARLIGRPESVKIPAKSPVLKMKTMTDSTIRAKPTP